MKEDYESKELPLQGPSKILLLSLIQFIQHNRLNLLN